MMMKGAGFGVRPGSNSCSATSGGCVILDKSLNLSEPQFPLSVQKKWYWYLYPGKAVERIDDEVMQCFPKRARASLAIRKIISAVPGADLCSC